MKMLIAFFHWTKSNIELDTTTLDVKYLRDYFKNNIRSSKTS